jgi:hypothetical protein
VRWIDDYPLLVVGIESVHPAVLSVSLTGAATKLSMLARRHGSPLVAFAPARAPGALENHSGIVTTASEDDLVPDAMMARFTSLVTAELGPLARLGIQRHVKTEGRPRYRDFAALVGKVTALANDNPLVRDRLRETALRLVPPGLVANAPRQAASTSAPSRPAQTALEAPRPTVSEDLEKATIVLGPAEMAQGAPSVADGPEIEISESEELEALSDTKKQPTRRKRSYVYRGRVYESDE